MEPNHLVALVSIALSFVVHTVGRINLGKRRKGQLKH